MSSSLFAGTGEMSALMRATAWEATPVGPVEGWPQSLRTAVSLVLESRFPMLLCWGPEFTQFYNDPFRPILGATKHPATGRSARDTYAEAWHIVGPLFDRVMAGEAVGFEDMLVPLDRHGFLEECYFTYSYSPIRAESGDVAGVFVTCTETTGRVIGERRLRLLQELAVDAAADRPADVCRRAAQVLARGTADLPFALLYLLDDDGLTLRREAVTGLPAGTPAIVQATSDATGPWPLRRALETGEIVVADVPESPSGRAFVAPVFVPPGTPTAVLVTAASGALPLNDQYRGFIALVAREIGASLGHAQALEYERRRANELAELDRAKTTFFSNVSHEFRTPLTLLLGPLEEALRGADPVLRGEELALVHRNALRLLKLVNTLLDFSRIEAGRASARLEATDLAQLTADLASTFQSAMARAGLRYHVHCDPMTSLVPVDRDAWEKIVLNLVSNALKFTFAGEVSVSLRERNGHVELQVEDSGVGIAEHELPHLFDRFHRVPGTRGRTHEGTGIGLALVHELVKMHDGSVAVASQPGKGTRFSISIPLGRGVDIVEAPAHPPAVATEETAAYLAEALRWLPPAEAPDAPTGAVARAAGPARILLVDDNDDMRAYVARLLSDRWVVEQATDGAAALDMARASPPALIVSDVMMPRLDGFELVRALRADASTREIPVIMLSARAGEESSVAGLEAGADDYVSKPFSARELRARVEAQLLRAEIRSVQAAHDRRFVDMFRHAPVAVAMLRGPEHVFEYVNDAYLTMLGRRDVLGQRMLDAVPELVGQGFGELLDHVYQSGQPYTAASRRITLNRGPEGAPEPAHFNFVYQPLRHAGGHTEGIAVIAVEVTELVRARNAAEEANRGKDHFLAVLGHELRNPLAPILTAVRLLELKGPPDPQLQKLRGTIARQATQLLTLVEDLLDVGRIITGKLRLEKRVVDIGVLATQAVEASTPFIERRRHTISVSVPESPLYVEVDSARISQVLCNLLNNAAKFTPEGGRIELSVADQNGVALVRVRDHGVGIPPHMLERVFERFVQADASTDRGSEGLGIGLSLVKTLVELHGGSVVARSDGAGTGSEFTVRMPVVAVEASSAS